MLSHLKSAKLLLQKNTFWNLNQTLHQTNLCPPNIFGSECVNQVETGGATPLDPIWGEVYVAFVHIIELRQEVVLPWFLKPIDGGSPLGNDGASSDYRRGLVHSSGARNSSSWAECLAPNWVCRFDHFLLPCRWCTTTASWWCLRKLCLIQTDGSFKMRKVAWIFQAWWLYTNFGLYTRCGFATANFLHVNTQRLWNCAIFWTLHWHNLCTQFSLPQHLAQNAQQLWTKYKT